MYTAVQKTGEHTGFEGLYSILGQDKGKIIPKNCV
jgi:hypothetical protein